MCAGGGGGGDDALYAGRGGGSGWYAMYGVGDGGRAKCVVGRWRAWSLGGRGRGGRA